VKVKHMKPTNLAGRTLLYFELPVLDTDDDSVPSQLVTCWAADFHSSSYYHRELGLCLYHR
jgi:hypothetical protein